MPDVALSSKSNEKYLLIAAFVQGNNFPKKTRTKFLIEAKFDGEQLSTDPVEHNETIEINQELAWEIDKKNLQLHRLQRSCIKANCFAVNEATGTKENVGYIVLDVRSAPDGVQITKEIPLLQSKYQKQKPTLQCMIYTESDSKTASSSAGALSGSVNNSRPGSALSNQSIDEDTRDNLQHQSYSSLKSDAKLTVDDQHGRFKIGKTSNMQHNYVLTITLVFAQNLVKLLAQPLAANLGSSEFFFAFKFLNNQFTSKPFADIVSCQINLEKCSFRLLTSLADLKTFLTQNGPLQILFCSSTKILAKTSLNWDHLSLLIKDKNALMFDSPITVDQVLKLESSESNSDRISPSTDIPVLGVQCSLEREISSEDENDSNRQKVHGTSDNGDVQTKKSGQPDVIYQNDTTTVTVENNPSTDNVILNVRARQLPESTIDENFMKFLTEEMQLKAAYELQIWKEQREKEFEANLKKREAKHFQTLADAFKQRDVERELIIQKKIKEYNELELLLKNSLNEVEKREKQLAFNESQIARLKADLHHDYETKLIEMREASKRVQEKADHQLNLQKSKIDNLDEEISKYRRQILELEKRYSDKETEFLRYKEKEHNRPEIKLQSEINMLKLEKMELERKLDAQTKAKMHYKEQFMKTLQELALLKKRDEANTRAFLKKQQMELDQLKMRCLGNNDSSASINGLSRKFQNELPFVNAQDNIENNLSENNIDSIDPALRQRINHLKEERECLMRTGAYSNTDDLIIELDRRIHDCLREAKITK